MKTDGINAFPGYRYEKGHNMYRGEDVGLGGYVYAEPGMYFGRIQVEDVSGLHPASIRALNMFGDHTSRFGDIVDARLAIKHGDYESARQMLNGQLAPYLTDPENADKVAKALKIAVNSVYGLTAAHFDNPFRDVRNANNIVALRGALFMVDLKNEVQERGFTVIAIKTDSIKILNPTEEIIQHCLDKGKQYGYSFEVENIFDRLCLVNNAVFIARRAEDDPEWLKECKKAASEGLPEPTRWTATGAQFAVPYVFKTLFSKEPLCFDDFCETKSVVKSSMYLDFNEDLPDVSGFEKEREKTLKKNPSADVSKLDQEIAKGHNYHFIGSVGQFCPMKPGTGGGLLVRTNGSKFDSVTGTKGYRWMESEVVRTLGKEDDIDMSYYQNLASDAIETIDKFGDFAMFSST